MRIGVVDYEAGNITSVKSALLHVTSGTGHTVTVSDDPDVLRASDRLIFPGVGEAKAAMNVLARRGLDGAIREFIASGKPVLGVCIGCQIIFDSSEESDTVCLGIIPGTAKLFSPSYGLKVPHMGWNTVRHNGHPLFSGIPSGSSFYFVHSYYPAPEDPSSAIAWTEYGLEFASGVVKDNLSAVQFHPEKSGKYGLKLLENFIGLEA